MTYHHRGESVKVSIFSPFHRIFGSIFFGRDGGDRAGMTKETRVAEASKEGEGGGDEGGGGGGEDVTMMAGQTINKER